MEVEGNTDCQARATNLVEERLQSKRRGERVIRCARVR